MSRHQLLTALRNECIVRQRVFHEKGMFPGPDPAVELPADKLLFFKEGNTSRVLIGLAELIKIVDEVLERKR